MGKLTIKNVENSGPGRHADGDGLYLLVKPTGTKSWLLRVQVDGKRRDFGLGSADIVSLKEARLKADEMRKVAKSGLDPIEEREKAKRVVPTFKVCAIECHTSMKGGWRNEKHRAQWLSTLTAYAFPELGAKRVDQIESQQIVKALAPIWLTKPETASRVRQRIAAVLDYAHSQGFRSTEAPTRSVGKGLPKQPRKDKHLEAMPYEDVPDFMATLREASETVGRKALMFTILAAGRSGEIRGAKWGEINEGRKLWTVPAERMKPGKDHTVPLTEQMLAILAAAKPLTGGAKDKLIFPGFKAKPLSDMTLSKVLRDMDLTCTVHGFRSSFRDWAAERTTFPGEVIEAALSHTIPNKVEAAYKRTDFLEKRRKLMEAWAGFVARKSNVVRLAI